jgi:hypothetical protein
MEKIFVKLKDAGASYIDSTQEKPMLLHGAEAFEVETTEMIKLGLRRGALVLSEGTHTEETLEVPTESPKEEKPKAKGKDKATEALVISEEPTGEKQEGVTEK